MMKLPNMTMQDFLERFPVIELPVTLTNESISDFQKNSNPLTQVMIDQFIPADVQETSKYVEFVPCFRLPNTDGFHAFVVWRGDIMKYHYLMITFDSDGKALGNAVIAGTESDGKSVVQSVATLDADWVIHIVEGNYNTNQSIYDALETRAYRMELMSTGEIIFLLNENGSDDG